MISITDLPKEVLLTIIEDTLPGNIKIPLPNKNFATLAVPVYKRRALRGELLSTANFNKSERMAELLAYGVDPNSSRDSYSALFIAANHNAYECAVLLIQYKANINAANANGSTPLHIAAQMGNAKLAKLLVDSGARVDIVDGSKQTPLHYARGSLLKALQTNSPSDWEQAFTKEARHKEEKEARYRKEDKRARANPRRMG